MPKKRQLILIIVVILVVLYGAYDMFKPGKAKTLTAQTQVKEIQTFTEQAYLEISKNTPPPFDAYLLNRAKETWGDSPFLGEEFYGKGGENTEDFIYTGFVDFGDCSFAIINNVQYKTGEALEKEGFILKKISPSNVIIKNNMENTEFTIPLFEQ